MGERVPVRDDLVDVVPYGAPQLDVPVRLNTNETAEAPDAGFLAEVARRLPVDLHRYPDREAWALRLALGEWHDLAPERVWAANGSNEVLLQLFQAYGGPGRRLLTTTPGYSAHPLIARVAGTEVVRFDLDEDLRVDRDVAVAAVRTHEPAIVVLANPNNPVGTPIDSEDVAVVHDAAEGLVVVDEAYVEFGGTSARSLLDTCERLVVTRTFSKAFRLAGLRLGYLLGQDWVVDDLRRVRLPYHLDGLTQVAGLVALEQRAALMTHIPGVVAERERVAAGLRAMDVQTWDATGNFLLFRVAAANSVFDDLLARGVLVRDFSATPGVEGCLRVTIGSVAENDAFLTALREVLGRR